MLMHFLGWLYAFVMAAMFSAGISLTPITVAWNSIWVYVTFGLCLIPGYLLAWLSIMAVVLILGLLGVGILGGGAMAADALMERNRRSRF